MAVVFEGHWFGVRDTDARLRALCRRHYSNLRESQPRRQYARARGTSNKTVGFGDYLALLTQPADACFIWVRPPDGVLQGGYEGVNCSIFRNEGLVPSSTSIAEAVDIAQRRWPGERLYTFVDPTRIRSTNPGYCFLQAGWRRLSQRTTTRNMVVLEVPAP